ncbi:LPS O-antigen chain length determinant protein WzzB [Tolumonas osonensis]|uniref:Chain length determinant protein (Polysaccharide antigen chain regulator) n=1 Tax=Tolumonas osonensis TaxID=675874 RepID=A0A841GAF5_9GAMM|nr:Wzz/FepE/Etk N-terminal domain-containing protein [Tolumonas osonensis]MBB6056038.1 chain length determinant protein (polysaccharide antigen chain regulator) [Tolumonas osonensis]
MNNKEFPQQANMPYPYPMPYQDNDEIDLIELFRTLWKQKAKIALITAATTVAAGIYAFTAEEVWTSKAVIAAPKASDIGEFYQLAQNLERNAPMITTPDGVQIKTEDTKPLQLNNLRSSLFNDFRRELESENERRSFVASTDYYREKIKDKSERDQKLVLQDIIEENISYTAADGKKIKFDTITFSANTAEKAQSLLQQYMVSLNKKVIKNNEAELNILLNKFRQDLSVEAKTLANNAEDQLKIEINTVASALAQAKGMNQTEPSANLPAEINNATMYLLGSKALSAKLALLQASEPVFPSRYFEVQQQLKSLNAIKMVSTGGKTFTYIDEPSEPVIKDKPKKIIIIVVGLFVGLLFGLTYAFFSTLFDKNSQQRN